MKKLLLLALLPALATLHATEYVFDNFDTTLLDANGQAWTGTLNVELGGFAGVFTPASTNLAQWPSVWLGSQVGSPVSSGYYDGLGPEWNAQLVLHDNTVYAAGTQLYLWAYDSNAAGPTSQWVLFTDPSWKMSTNDPLDIPNYAFSFSRSTTALIGSFSFDTQSAATAAAVSAVPEPATWAAWGGLLALGWATHRRLRRPPAGRSAAPALPLET